jgi:ornithine cyclodeaminase
MSASLRIISGDQVRALLPMDSCIDLMGETLAGLSAGRGQNPLRSAMPVGAGPDRFGLMPGALADPAVFGIKMLSLFPGNSAAGLSSHLGLVALFEADHGQPVALLEASALTAIRTAAVSALATRLLARTGAGDLALLGSGEQADSHLEAVRRVRQIRRVRVWSRSLQNAAAFAARHGEGIEVCEDVADAVAGADIICAVTGARIPILKGAMVGPGVHINAVGACIPVAAEVDTALVAKSRYVVDFRASAAAEAGEYLSALAAGAIAEDHIVAELGEIASGAVVGRRSQDEITLFKSLGLAVEDLAAAAFVLEAARARGVGQVVTL